MRLQYSNQIKLFKNGQSRETGNTAHARRRQTKQKHHTPIYAKTKTHNVNRTRALLQTTGNEEEPNIVDKHHFVYIYEVGQMFCPYFLSLLLNLPVLLILFKGR